MANTIQIVITTKANTGALSGVSKDLGGLGKSASGATGLLGGFGSALGNVATIAGGIIAANIFGKIVSGIASFATTGLEAVGSAQQLETSLKALLTQNNMYEESVETVTQAITKQVMSQGELAIKNDELNAKLATQKATYQEQQEQIRQLTDRYGENGLAVIKAKAKHDQLALAIQKTEREIAGLTTSETEYTTVTKTAVTQAMSQADAFKIAGQQTKELLDFISQVAVISPFETEDVEMTTKYAVAAGLGVEQTKEFVPAFLDLAGAVGITSSELGFAADQLFQVKKIGKLTTIDLRQLRRLGIDLGKVLAVEMGMSIEEFNTEAEKSPAIFDDLFEAITRYSQNTFAGTSREMATSVKGLKSTLNDIFVIGARNFWRPLVDAVTPMASEILGKLSNFVLGGDIASLGQRLADTLMSGLSMAKGLINIAKTLGLEAAFQVVIQMIKNAWPGIQDALMVWGSNFWNFITETVIPTGQEIITTLASLIGGFIAENWPTIQAKLFEWRDKFFGWVLELYPQIPTVLTALVTNIATWLSENWPMISESLMTWTTQFWDWAKEAALNVAVGLGALVAAMVAWVTGGEGQTALNNLGQQIGQMIVDMVTINLEGGEGAATVMTTLALGLLAAVEGVLGTLILAGAQIVAGIVSGILEALGIDLQPALISELGAILGQIGTDIMTIANTVGTAITQGFSDGIMAGLTNLMTTVKEVATVIINAIKSELGISSPSTVFFSFGIDILQGLIDGIRSLLGSLPAIMGEITGTLTEAWTGLISSLFGGGEGGTSLFDPTATLEGLTSINIFLSEIIPENLLILTEQFTLLFTTVTEQLTLLTVGPLTLFIFTMSTIYLLHIPMLQNSWIAMTAIIVAQIMLTVTNLNTMITTIQQTQAAGTAMATAIVTGFSSVISKVAGATNKFEELISIILKAVEAFEKLKSAAEAAASAAKSAGTATGAATGIGFQHGTGPLGFLVPPGFQNDSFPIGVTSGERVLVAPRGQSIEGIVGGRTVNNYFNMTVNTQANQSTVIGDFKVMQSLLGT